MRWIVVFDDAPEMMARRQQYRLQHVDYVRRHQDEILIGGGLKTDQDSDFVGGLWICEVESRTRLEELVKNDPYYDPAIRNYQLRLWGKVLPEVTATL
ncbi:MAG: YciI family protein [Pseudomonadota bacterium]